MELSIQVEKWPIQGAFVIARGAKTEAEVIVVTVRDGVQEGRGECVPYRRYNETVESVQKQLASISKNIARGIDRYELKNLLPAGAARNALDCALWDLEAKQPNTNVWRLVGVTPRAIPTAFTISLDTPEHMAARAEDAAKKYSLLKIKLGTEGDEVRLQKIRQAAPQTRLIVDANEGWTGDSLEKMVRACESVGVELIEQPVPVADDSVLEGLQTSIKICADESVHTSDDVPGLSKRYGAVNIKLDKTGGLTEALDLARVAHTAGLMVMAGCLVSTSLSMAPATVLAQFADYVDLDAPLLLARDREPAIQYQHGAILPTTPALWG